MRDSLPFVSFHSAIASSWFMISTTFLISAAARLTTSGRRNQTVDSQSSMKIDFTRGKT